MTAPKNLKPLGPPIAIPASQALANLEVSRDSHSHEACAIRPLQAGDTLALGSRL